VPFRAGGWPCGRFAISERIGECGTGVMGCR
jgi:hypothetical protein